MVPSSLQMLSSSTPWSIPSDEWWGKPGLVNCYSLGTWSHGPLSSLIYPSIAWWFSIYGPQWTTDSNFKVKMAPIDAWPVLVDGSLITDVCFLAWYTLKMEVFTLDFSCFPLILRPYVDPYVDLYIFPLLEAMNSFQATSKQMIKINAWLTCIGPKMMAPPQKSAIWTGQEKCLTLFVWGKLFMMSSPPIFAKIGACLSWKPQGGPK